MVRFQVTSQPAGGSHRQQHELVAAAPDVSQSRVLESPARRRSHALASLLLPSGALPAIMRLLSMKRRRLIGLIVAATLVTGGVAVAAVLTYQVRWTKAPSITVIAATGDPRIPLVHEAVDYWNRVLVEVGTPFRLGEVSVVTGSVPDADVLALDSIWRPTLPASLQQYSGDLLVVLSDASFISLTSPRGQRIVIAIKSHEDPRMTPNIMRNVIAHELGHAIGLRHNADPTMLMCGRPASCRPGIYRSEIPRFFPLSTDDEARLHALYPANWTTH